jgi:hypothetical protein
MNPLHSRLAALRRRLRLVVGLRGVCAAVAVVLLGLLAAGLADGLYYAFFRRETWSLLRAAALVATLSGAAGLTYFLLIRPLRTATDDLSLALRVEEQYPILNDALASTVQFLEQPGEEAGGTSASLRKEAVQRALRLAQGCDFGKAVDSRGLRLVACAVVGLVAVMIPLVFLQPAAARTALARFLDPFGDHPWRLVGAQTQIELEYPRVLAVNQPLTIRGTIRGTIPEKASVEFDDATLQPRSVDVQKSTGIFLVKDIKSESQRKEIRFRVHAGDAVSPAQTGTWHVVTLKQPPQLAWLNGKPSPQIELRQPRYTGLAEFVTLPAGTGNLDVLAGTHVTLRAGTDVPVIKAWVEFKPVAPFTKEVLRLAPVGAPGPVAATTTTGLGHSGWGRVEAVLDKNGKEFTVRFVPTLTGAYVLKVQDKDGLANAFEYELTVREDPAPVVTLLQPSVSQSVLANAEITLQLTAEDEKFGLKSVYVEYRRKNKHGEWIDPAPKRIPFFDHEASARATEVAALFAGKPLRLLVPVIPQKPAFFAGTRRWSLKGLVSEGETVVIQGVAEDFNDVPAFPQPGRSTPEVELKVVGKAALAAVIDEREADVHQQLLKLRELQDAALKKVIGVEAQWRTTGKLRPEDLVELAEAMQLQKDIQGRIGATKDDGLRGTLNQIEQMLKDNKLPKSEVGERLKAVREELENINREHLPKIDLDAAKRKLEAQEQPRVPAPNESGELGDAKAEQQKVYKALDDLLSFLGEHSTFQQLKGELRAILQEQRDRNDETQKLEAGMIARATAAMQAKGGPKGPKLQPPTKEQQLNALKSDVDLKAQLRRTAELQRRLADRAKRLLDRLQELADKTDGKDNQLHEMLMKAIEIGTKEEDLVGAMRDINKQLFDEFDKTPVQGKKNAEPQVWRALAAQDLTIGILEKMLEALDQTRADELERLKVQQDKQGKQLDDLGAKLGALQKEIDKALKIEDPDQRAKALKALAEKQRALQKEAEQRAADLARRQAHEAAEEMHNAAKKMERVARELDRGEDPKEALDQAKDNVDRAKDRLDEARKATEEELGREQIAKIVDQLKGLKERQDGFITEAERLNKAVVQARYWDIKLLQSYSALSDAQGWLAKDAGLLRNKIKGAKVYAAILDRAVKDMDGAVGEIGKHKLKAVDRQQLKGGDKKDKGMGDEALADEKARTTAVVKLQRDASDRIQRLIDALLPELEARGPEDPKQNPDNGGKDGPKDEGKKGGLKAQDGIPGVAQLKALKGEQLDVNARTKAFAEAHPDLTRLTPEQQAELDGISAEQDRLLQLFRDMATAAAEGGKKE